jgi:hypothetical protein
MIKASTGTKIGSTLNSFGRKFQKGRDIFEVLATATRTVNGTSNPPQSLSNQGVTMLRRLMIGLAATIAMVALTTAPAGASAGNVEVYSAPNYSGTHVTVPSTTVVGYMFRCVSVDTLTSGGLTTSQSMINNTQFDLGLYGGTGCSPSSFVAEMIAGSQWTTSTGQTVRFVFIAGIR